VFKVRFEACAFGIQFRSITANCSVWLCTDSVVVCEGIVTSVNLAVSLVAKIRFVECLIWGADENVWI